MDRNTMDKNRTNIEGGVVFMDKLIIKIDENYMYKVYDTLKEFSVYIFLFIFSLLEHHYISLHFVWKSTGTEQLSALFA